MVKKTETKSKEVYSCKICKLEYETQELAQKCEDFCRENDACSLEITKYALNK